MPEMNRIAVSSLRPPADNPRSKIDEAELSELADSLKRQGQLVPIITVGNEIVDGERRWRAAQLAGIEKLDAIVLSSRPTVTELRLLQMSIDVHRTNLTAMERSDLLAKIKQETGWSVQEMAAHTGIKQPSLSKLLKLQDGCPEVKAELSSSSLDIDKAYTICQEPDPVKQREFLNEVRGLTREQLRQKIRSNGRPVDLRAAIARFPLSSGVVVSVQGRKVNLAGAIEALLEAVKELKRGQAEHWDITTAMRVLRDRCKAHS